MYVALGFAALLATGATAGWVMVLSQDRLAWVTHSYEVERHIEQFRFQLTRLEAARRGYLIDQDPTFRGVFAEAQAAAAREIVVLKGLTPDNPRQRARLAELEAELERLGSMLSISMNDIDLGVGPRASNDFKTDGSVALATQARHVTTAMLDEENALLDRRIMDQKRAVDAFFAVLAVSAILLIAVAAASLLVILRYTRDLARSRDSLRALNDNLELAVEARTTELKRANDEIQRFAYIVSHDLRSPLVNVLGFTAELDAARESIGELLENAEADAPQLVTEEIRRVVHEDIPEAIGFIRTSTQKMDRLINAILKLSREGRRTIAPERLDMDRMVQDIADSLQHRVDDIGAKINIEKPLPALTTDRVAIEQILSNLVENAVKYLQPGRPGQIHVRGQVAQGRAVFEVQDNGRGIDPRDHNRVFDLFRRSGVQDQPGEGIGLAHVRAMAYRLGGVVACESALGEGATFRVSLPQVYAGGGPE
jgi:signal transduction histidine kinase